MLKSYPKVTRLLGVGAARKSGENAAERMTTTWMIRPDRRHSKSTKIALQLQEKALAELKNLPDGSMTPKDIIQFLDKATELERDNRMEEAGVTAGGKTAEEQEETTLSLADEIAAAYENRKRGEQT